MRCTLADVLAAHPATSYPKSVEIRGTFCLGAAFYYQQQRSVSMHRAICVLSLASLATLSAPLAMAQSYQSQKIEATNLPDHPFQVEYTSGGQLNLHLRSGDMRITG